MSASPRSPTSPTSSRSGIASARGCWSSRTATGPTSTADGASPASRCCLRAAAAALPAEPAGLYEVVWRNREVDLVPTEVGYVDAADPSSYLLANLMLSGGESVIGAGARVEGDVERCVVWPGATVLPGEHLVEVVRARGLDGGPLTVAAPQERPVGLRRADRRRAGRPSYRRGCDSHPAVSRRQLRRRELRSGPDLRPSRGDGLVGLA